MRHPSPARLLSSWALLVLFLASSACAEGPRLIREGIVVKVPAGFGEAVPKADPVQAALVSGTWKAPRAGDRLTFAVRPDSIREEAWETMTADSLGWFTHPALRGGYAYVTFDSPSDQVMLLQGMGHGMVYVNGVPRSGNPYQVKESWEAWEPRFDYSLIPIEAKAGTNELLFSGGRGTLKVKLIPHAGGAFFNTHDLTLPTPIVGQALDAWGAIVVVNAADRPLRNASITVTSGAAGPGETTVVPIIQPMSVRKVGVKLRLPAQTAKGHVPLRLALHAQAAPQGQPLDTASILLTTVDQGEPYAETFISGIDGSVQYYAVNPRKPEPAAAATTSGGVGQNEPGALFLSLHGANVEAMNQARAYAAKTWGTIVCPTNRRPYGYNWEDWGRLDALEVLDRAQKEFAVSPDRIYLTGHSMGGHGTYHVGVTFPDRFAAIGPSAGWISFWSYRVRERTEPPSPLRAMLMRAALPSETFALSDNFRQYGMFIIHGSADDNVPPEQSRMMADHLARFHKDYIFFEKEGVGHWWDSPSEGGGCVDWPPLFDFFARHARPGSERIRQVDFTTANPGVSARSSWLTIAAQQEPLTLSSVSIRFDPGQRRFVGSTRNVARLMLDLAHVAPGDSLTVILDRQRAVGVATRPGMRALWLERKDSAWYAASEPSPALKGPHRNGTFKDLFRNRMLFVVGTHGSAAENAWAAARARFDAERFWYQGNGSIDVIADVDFRPDAERDRNVVLYGNARTNAAWEPLFAHSPVQLLRGRVSAGERKFSGDDIACVFLIPRPGSTTASVGIVGGTGIAGMRLTDRLPYFSPGIGLPDCLIFDSRTLTKGDEGVLGAGFFGPDWKLETGDFIWGKR